MIIIFSHLVVRDRSFAWTCPCAKIRQLRILVTIDTCYHRPAQRSTVLAYFCHSRPLGNTHCWHCLWVTGLCLFIAVDIVQLRYSPTVQSGEGGDLMVNAWNVIDLYWCLIWCIFFRYLNYKCLNIKCFSFLFFVFCFYFRIRNPTLLQEGYSFLQQALSFDIAPITTALEVVATLRKSNLVTEKESPSPPKQLCSLKFK